MFQFFSQLLSTTTPVLTKLTCAVSILSIPTRILTLAQLLGIVPFEQDEYTAAEFSQQITISESEKKPILSQMDRIKNLLTALIHDMNKRKHHLNLQQLPLLLANNETESYLGVNVLSGSMVVSRNFLISLAPELSDMEIKAYLAHEIGHIINDKKRLQSLLIMENTLLIVLALLPLLSSSFMLNCGIAALCVLPGYFNVNRTEQSYFKCIEQIGCIGRRREIAADEYSANHVAYKYLIEAAKKMDVQLALEEQVPSTQPEPSLILSLLMNLLAPWPNIQSSLIYHLFETHPSTEQRSTHLATWQTKKDFVLLNDSEENDDEFALTTPVIYV